MTAVEIIAFSVALLVAAAGYFFVGRLLYIVTHRG